MKKLLYTWFANCYALFGLSELIDHMYAVWGWDWSMAFYELCTGDRTIIPAFCWCMGLTELNFEVEALLQHRSRGDSRQYLVRWLGYGPEHDEWIHEEELANGAGAFLKQCQDSDGLLWC